jgi:hypothetical protein
MLKKLFTLCAVALLAVTVGGCGSNLDSDGSSSGDTTLADAQPLGINNCLTCHQTGIGETWLVGVHANPNNQPDSGLVDPSCLTCHDQLGDGQKLFAATNEAEANRPVVSCESCHGGGQYHNGIAAGIPFAVPDSNRCGQCHNATFPHGSSPEGKGIVEAFQASPHSRSLNTSVFVAGTTDVRALCAKCHSDEGAKQYLNVDGDYAFLSANLPDTLAPLSDVSNIDCRTCHSPHQEDQLLEAASTGRSAEFNTCTNCHQLLQASNSEKIIAYHDPAANQFGAANEIITDTHFATPGNFPGGSARGANQNDITGYAMNFASDRVCRDCHNPHNANNEINNQWAESGHADKTAAGAWAHYNWTEVANAFRNDFSATSDRTTCQRCHTTTGVIAYLTANADANPSEYVAPLPYDPNFKPEMLKCNGCHTDNVGSLRTTGQITAPYTNAPDQYPAAAGSNLCLACHTGVESGESIKNSSANFAATGFINSHYLTAGGTVFGKSGYTFGDRNYAIPAGDRHDKIGMGIATGDANFDAVRGNYTEGPCVTCHFGSNDGSHTLSPLTEYAPGDVSLNPVCVVCHPTRGVGTNAETTWLGTEAIAATLQGTTHKARYQAALEALKVQLANNGYTFTTGYPYFANTNWVSVADPTGKNNMGAAFNYNLLIHDPGGVAHNRRYTRRLIYDAIDHLDDGILNYSVFATLNALDVAAVYKASAIAYLINNGPVNGGTAAERF